LKLLNIEMDKLAKVALQVKPMFDVEGAPWSIWILGNKIVKDIPYHICNTVHGPMAVQYWEKHKKKMSIGKT
jgi:hypothetical protein